MKAPSVTALLTLLFVALKLTGCIQWSWAWVFCPLWIYGALVVVVLVFTSFITLLMHEINKEGK